MAKFDINKLNKIVDAVSTKKEGLEENANFKIVDISEIEENIFNKNVFRNMNEEEFNSLCESIKKVGLTHPLIVTRENDKYRLISGEQRKRALEFLKIKKVPVIVKRYKNETEEKLALIHANIKERKLTEMDLARAIEQEKKILEKIGYKGNKIEKIAEDYNMSVSKIKRAGRLNNLIPEIQEMVENGTLKSGKAEKISKLNPEKQTLIFEKFQQDIKDLSLEEINKNFSKRDEIIDDKKTEIETKNQHNEEELSVRDYLKRNKVSFQKEIKVIEILENLPKERKTELLSVFRKIKGGGWRENE